MLDLGIFDGIAEGCAGGGDWSAEAVECRSDKGDVGDYGIESFDIDETAILATIERYAIGRSLYRGVANIE